METEDDIYTGYHNYTISERMYGNMSEQNTSTTFGDIELPLNFKTVIMKLHPEIKDVVADYFETKQNYNPETFNPVTYFQVAVKVFIHQDETPKGNKDFYKKSFKDLFIMTYGSEMDFISFVVTSIIIPPPKTNEEKFAELFGKDYICKK